MSRLSMEDVKLDLNSICFDKDDPNLNEEVRCFHDLLLPLKLLGLIIIRVEDFDRAHTMNHKSVNIFDGGMMWLMNDLSSSFIS
ncbi:hypothetical protein H5410_021093 [Solanum commersonii]|uniref:Uncharacterized protein n=1 Tax=Solanum commersonii TaxID=4109 RepID=A0A9J5ZE69_SOLCO|nr:hypothetical protein H5410_021093 [Solanum commersonii]